MKTIEKNDKSDVKSVKSDIKVDMKTININNDVLYNLLLQSSSENITELCLVNKEAVKICNDNHFWQQKLKNEGYYTIQIIKIYILN